MVQRRIPTSARQRGVPGGLIETTQQTESGSTKALAAAVNLSVIGGATVPFDGSGNVVLPSGVRFGSGAPSTLIGEGVFYVDTGTYNLYVQHSAAWHLIS